VVDSFLGIQFKDGVKLYLRFPEKYESKYGKTQSMNHFLQSKN
jgi:hypothetical protein